MDCRELIKINCIVPGFLQAGSEVAPVLNRWSVSSPNQTTCWGKAIWIPFVFKRRLDI